MVMPGWFPAIICNLFRDRANISSRKRYKRGFLEPLRRSKNETAHSLWAGYIIVATIQYTRHKEEIWVSFCALHCLSSFGVGGGFQDIRQGVGMVGGGFCLYFSVCFGLEIPLPCTFYEGNGYMVSMFIEWLGRL